MNVNDGARILADLLYHIFWLGEHAGF